MTISADDVLGYLTGGLDRGRLYGEDDELVAMLWTNYADGGLVYATAPDTEGRQVLGRFRVTVEEVPL